MEAAEIRECLTTTINALTCLSEEQRAEIRSHLDDLVTVLDRTAGGGTDLWPWAGLVDVLGEDLGQALFDAWEVLVLGVYGLQLAQER